MAKVHDEFDVRLAPEDEYPHEPGDVSNYNESMYFNVFDPETKAGGWFRIGNRPNEGYAEVSVCVYLPHGRVGFIFARPQISGNTQMKADGLSIEVIEPFHKLALRYEGDVLLLSQPHDMADPRKAFKNNPKVRCRVDLHYEGVSPVFGGETVRRDGKPMNIDPEKSFAKAHYEQHCAASGTIAVGDGSFTISGYGLRDKSWGPRYWQAIDWYRWCPMNFGRDFGMMLSVIGNGEGGVREGGMVFRDGVYDLVSECRLESDWDENDYQTGLRAEVKTVSGKFYRVSGRVLSLIPLRNRRQTSDGEELVTRITEGMTEYRCDGQTGYGLSEYLDQIRGGKPSGRSAGF